jgi:hypothetical protein
MHVRHGLCAVDQRGDAASLRGGDQAPNRQDRAQGVRYVCKSEQARARAHQRHHRVLVNLAARIDGRDHEPRARLFAHHLPRHDVGVVFQMRDEYLVAGFEHGPRVALGDQIDRFGGAAHENDLVPRPGADELFQPVPCRLV